MNEHLRTVVVARMAPGNRPATFRIPVNFQSKGRLMPLDQPRTLDRQRLVKRFGTVKPDTLAAVQGGL